MDMDVNWVLDGVQRVQHRNLCGFDLFQSERNPNSDPLFLLNDSMRLFAVKNRSVKLSPKISRAKALGMISRLFVRQPGAPLDYPFHEIILIEYG
jgi:hypothetical protein